MKNKKTKNILIVSITLAVLICATVALILATRKPSDKVNPSECDHHFEVTDSVSASEFAPGKTNYKCSVCGEEKTERKNATGILPQIYFDGVTEGIGKDSAVQMKAEYIDGDQAFNSFATIKYQGHTAMNYDKKNYTLKLFEDENSKEKYKVSLHGWKKSNKYCLKANYIDFSQARNVVFNNIWSEVVASRKNLDSNIADLDVIRIRDCHTSQAIAVLYLSVICIIVAEEGELVTFFQFGDRLGFHICRVTVVKVQSHDLTVT